MDGDQGEAADDFAFQPAASFDFSVKQVSHLAAFRIPHTAVPIVAAPPTTPARGSMFLAITLAGRLLTESHAGDAVSHACHYRQATTSAAQRRESLAQLSGIRSKIGMWETAKQPRATPSRVARPQRVTVVALCSCSIMYGFVHALDNASPKAVLFSSKCH